MRNALLVCMLVTACGSSDPSPSPEDAAGDTSVASDTLPADTASAETFPIDLGVETPADTSVTAMTEKEPNDGKAAADVNPFTIPGDITGTIDPADDIDIMSVTLNAGDLWTWSLVGTGGGMTPHLGVSQNGNRVPTLVAVGSDQEHFVLETETYFVIVRDARNVPMSTSKHVGGPELKWKLGARRLDKTPTSAAFPSTLMGKLTTRTANALYAFSGMKDFAFDIVLRAQRKTPASNMDSRMSLYEKTTKKWVLTNDDDAMAGTKDSHIGGALPVTGDYVVVVENVSPDATDLSFELMFTKR